MFQNKDIPIENATDCLSTMASICRVMIENPYVPFCYSYQICGIGFTGDILLTTVCITRVFLLVGMVTTHLENLDLIPKLSGKSLGK